MRNPDDRISVVKALATPNNRRTVLAVTLADVPDVGVEIIVTELQAVSFVTHALREGSRESVAQLLDVALRVQHQVDVLVVTTNFVSTYPPKRHHSEPLDEPLLEALEDISAQSVLARHLRD